MQYVEKQKRNENKRGNRARQTNSKDNKKEKKTMRERKKEEKKKTVGSTFLSEESASVAEFVAFHQEFANHVNDSRQQVGRQRGLRRLDVGFLLL
jgi:hypothetical protein